MTRCTFVSARLAIGASRSARAAKMGKNCREIEDGAVLPGVGGSAAARRGVAEGGNFRRRRRGRRSAGGLYHTTCGVAAGCSDQRTLSSRADPQAAPHLSTVPAITRASARPRKFDAATSRVFLCLSRPLYIPHLTCIPPRLHCSLLRTWISTRCQLLLLVWIILLTTRASRVQRSSTTSPSTACSTMTASSRR